MCIRSISTFVDGGYDDEDQLTLKIGEGGLILRPNEVSVVTKNVLIELIPLNT